MTAQPGPVISVILCHSHWGIDDTCYERFMCVRVYVCICWSSHRARVVWINRVRLPILLVVSWTGKNNTSLSAFAPENLVSRDGFGSPVPRQLAHIHTQTESRAYLRDSSRVPRRCVCVFFPFILDIKFVGRTSRGRTGGRSHRISHPPSFCGACLSFSREKDPAIPFSRQPWSRILCTTSNGLIVLHPLGIFICVF